MSVPTRDVRLEAIGSVREQLLAALSRNAVGPSDRGPGLVIVVGSVSAESDSLSRTDLVESAVVTVFLHVQAFMKALPKAGADANIIVLVDDESALGDPTRVLDSTVAGALVSMSRSFAIEFARSGTNVTTLFTSTVDRDREDVQAWTDNVARRVRAALDEGVETTGQEIFAGAGTQLGRLRP